MTAGSQVLEKLIVQFGGDATELFKATADIVSEIQKISKELSSASFLSAPKAFAEESRSAVTELGKQHVAVQAVTEAVKDGNSTAQEFHDTVQQTAKQFAAGVLNAEQFNAELNRLQDTYARITREERESTKEWQKKNAELQSYFAELDKIERKEANRRQQEEAAAIGKQDAILKEAQSIIDSNLSKKEQAENAMYEGAAKALSMQELGLLTVQETNDELDRLFKQYRVASGEIQAEADAKKALSAASAESLKEQNSLIREALAITERQVTAEEEMYRAADRVLKLRDAGLVSPQEADNELVRLQSVADAPELAKLESIKQATADAQSAFTSIEQKFYASLDDIQKEIHTLPEGAQKELAELAKAASGHVVNAAKAVADASNATTKEAAEAAEAAAKASAELGNESIKAMQKVVSNAHQANATLLILGHSMMVVGQQLGSLATSINQYVVAPLISVGKTAIMAASDAEESANKFREVFGYVADEAERMAKVLDNSFGMSRVEARKLMASTGDLLNAFGFTKKGSLDLSVEVQKLAADMVSFSNFEGGVERASTAITRALLGEKEMLKLLGKAILDKDVRERVALNTQRGVTFETDRQAKAFATLQLIQEQSMNAVGDYQRTAWQFANQLRELQSTLQDVAAAFGQDLLPAATSVVSTLNNTASWFKDLSPAMRLVIEVAAGLALAVAGLVAAFLTVGSTIVYLAGLTYVLSASWAYLSSTIVAAATAITGAVQMATVAVLQFAVAALMNPVGLAVAIIAIAAALSVAAYKLSLWASGYTDAMERATALTEKLKAEQAENNDSTISQAAGIQDLKVRNRFLQEQIELTQKNIAGQKEFIEAQKLNVEAEAPAWYQFGTNYNQEVEKERLVEQEAELVEMEKHLQKMQDMRNEISRNNSEEVLKFQIESGVEELTGELEKELAIMGQLGKASELYDLRQQGATEEQLKAVVALNEQVEAKKALTQLTENVEKNIEDWQTVAATVGMTSREVDVYRAAIAGLDPTKLQEMAAAAKAADMAELNKDGFERAEEWAREAASIGMSSREAEIYKARLDGVSESMLSLMSLADQALTIAEASGKLSETTDEWKMQAAAVSLTSRQVEILKAAMDGASEESIQAAMAADKALTGAERGKKVNELTKDLETQAATFGMSSAEVAIYKLALDGATAAELAHANALAQTLKAKDEQKKLQEKAKQLNEEHRSPIQKLKDGAAELTKMFDAGMISAEVLDAEMQDLEDQFKKEYTAKLNFEGAEGLEAGSAEDIAKLRAFFAQQEADKLIADMINGADVAAGQPGFMSIPPERTGPDTPSGSASRGAVVSNPLGGGADAKDAAYRDRILTALEMIATNTNPQTLGTGRVEFVSSGLSD